MSEVTSARIKISARYITECLDSYYFSTKTFLDRINPVLEEFRETDLKFRRLLAENFKTLYNTSCRHLLMNGSDSKIEETPFGFDHVHALMEMAKYTVDGVVDITYRDLLLIRRDDLESFHKPFESHLHWRLSQLKKNYEECLQVVESSVL
uniref:Uncharacterized protein n=1 Tax=Rhizobium phage LG08 TaxID=3129229 RepID=A0AAU8HYL7_9CAUD